MRASPATLSPQIWTVFKSILISHHGIDPLDLAQRFLIQQVSKLEQPERTRGRGGLGSGLDPTTGDAQRWRGGKGVSLVNAGVKRPSESEFRESEFRVSALAVLGD